MDKAKAGQLARRMEELLKPMEAELGVRVTFKGGTFDPETGSLRPRIEVAEISENGEGPEAREFRSYCGLFGLQPEDLGRYVRTPKGLCKVIGLNMRARSMPILVTDPQGRRLKMREFARERLVDAPAKS